MMWFAGHDVLCGEELVSRMNARWGVGYGLTHGAGCTRVTRFACGFPGLQGGGCSKIDIGLDRLDGTAGLDLSERHQNPWTTGRCLKIGLVMEWVQRILIQPKGEENWLVNKSKALGAR